MARGHEQLVPRLQRLPIVHAQLVRIRIGDEETLALLDGASIGDLPVFNEWRGGLGMSLAVARRILNAHGGHVAAPPDGRKTGAIIVFRP